MPLSKLKFIGLALLLLSCTEVSKIDYKTIDGDTYSISDPEPSMASTQYELAYIDAPEREQPFGREAREYLKEILSNEKVTIKTLADSKVELFIDGRSINFDMVSKGYAWASLQILDQTIKQQYIDAQKQATENVKGLWRLDHGLMIAPWQWREQGQEKIPSMNYQKQRLLKRQKEQQVQKEAAMQKQREYAKRRALQKQNKKSMNKSTIDKD
jgi:micrococcal nuclease